MCRSTSYLIFDLFLFNHRKILVNLNNLNSFFSFSFDLKYFCFLTLFLLLSFFHNCNAGLKQFEILVHGISCTLCRLLVHVCATTKKIASRQYFSVSCAPYRGPPCTPYRKDFKLVRLQISYDLKYLKLFVIAYLFHSADNILSYVLV